MESDFVPDKFIKDKKYNSEGELKVVKILDEYLSLDKFKNNFSFILNAVKPSFSFNYIEFYKLKFDSENNTNEYIGHITSNEITLNDLSSDKIKENIIYIRRILTFNWLMCVNQNDISEVKHNLKACPFVKSDIADVKNSSNLIFYYINEDLPLKYLHNDKNPSKYLISGSKDLPMTIIKEFFSGSKELFYKYVSMIAKGIDPNKLKFKLESIVNIYDKKYTIWINLVYNRFMNAKDIALSGKSWESDLDSSELDELSYLGNSF